MKKVYVSLLLATNVLSLSSAECHKEKHLSSVGCQQKQQLFPPLPYSDTTEFPLTTFEPPKSVPMYAKTTQADLEKYNKIINAPYKSNQPILTDPTTLTDPIPLATVYTQTNNAIKNQEKKPFLKKNISSHDDMQKLCNDALKFVFSTKNNKRLDQKTQDKKLVLLIDLMNNARANGIDEDIMGKFACNNKNKDYDNDINAFVPLFFSLLKKYKLTVTKTKELLPFNIGKKTPHLTQIFDSSPDTNKKCDTSNIKNLYSDLNNCHAFLQLQYALRHALQEYSDEIVDIFTSCLYLNEKILLEDYSEGSYTDLENEFYAKAYYMLLHEKSNDGLYDLTQIIDKAKNSKNIKEEKELGYKILTLEPTWRIVATFCGFIDPQHSTMNVKNRISIFCKFVEEYNDARRTKITPTTRQYNAYHLKENLDIDVSDSFNRYLFDEDKYAFAAFEQLRYKTKILIKSDDQEIQECVAQQYPQKK